MRPNILFPLFADVSNLAGIGSKTRSVFKRIIGDKVIDILYHYPKSAVDRRYMPSVRDMKEGDVVTVVIKVDAHIPPARAYDKNSPYKVRCYNETGFVTLVFFNAYSNYLKKLLPVGQARVISGKIDKFAGEIQMAHPEYIAPVSDIDKIRIVEPVYPLSSGIGRKTLMKAMNDALKRVSPLPEWISTDYLQHNKWDSWANCIINMHKPIEPEDILPDSKIMCRLAYDELLANQLALAIVRKYVNKTGGVSMRGDGSLRKQLSDSLPFELTAGQFQVIKEINDDQESDSRMMRLLQGDVGSGKTVLALMAALNAVEAGKQVAVMAPTEILALQHMNWITQVTEGINCNVRLLIGKTKGKKREEIINDLKGGKIDIIIGTHALFQDAVGFKDLGLIIIDEQHRFGVAQRMSLAAKGQNVDVLLMTATPIPRTLTMTLYGDMECSRLTDKPKGRKMIDTRIVPAAKIDNIVERLWSVIDRGEKIYWICPLIEESEMTGLANVEERFKALSKIFKGMVGMVHGRMDAQEREKTMTDFKEGDIDILVATTVVEVGVDVPDATVIIIEHAERFGLSQLHQLRGRVGRNDKQSGCVLLYHDLGEISVKRLKIMRESNDGFYLSEEDLKIRGGGDVLGTKQSGLPEFKVADLYTHMDLLRDANKDAAYIMETDPKLQTERGKSLEMLLYLFGFEKQVSYIEKTKETTFA
ncbi:MAG: ATP-dependent DNA helicase RecG [Alphaproteobacteria bacterium CG11_big_fil_rev_8_21_14_0_20_39_49]|nr:MAG: ATP-dependent DNA helicase RecG [Alphaproteobacteria bacterium CG11_big_fil_rev_8_21_14_0_20_39_49]